MVFSATATVYAAENSGGNSTINVAGEYSVASTGEVVSVDVGWEEMSFKYTEGEKQWDPGTHSYIGGENGGWSDNKLGITMTNHSNVDVKATFTYAPESGNTLTGAFTYDNSKTADSTGAVSLAKGVEGQVNAADYVTATLKLSGTPSDTMTDFTKVGTITVKITK